MTVKEFNEQLRTIVEEKLKDNYKKSNITAILLGTSSGQQMDNFIKGNNFGFKPLARIAEAFDCELHITFVPKNDEELKNKINQISETSLTNLDFLLGETLENVTNDSSIRRGRPKNSSIVEKTIIEKAEEIIKNVIS